MCTKAPYIFMPLHIPGPNDPTKDFHVYLRPLIDELKMLWSTGVETYDRVSRSNFNMKVALMWTLNDFPTLGMISGWSPKGKLACPVCIGLVKAKKLKNDGKLTFYGTTPYFLEEDDPLRRSFLWFFNPMEHLPLQLVIECKLRGPFNHRWMYFIERYLHGLKLKVKNKARAEGSMAERYIEEEVVHFYELYFESKVKTVHNRLRQNEVPRRFLDPSLLEVKDDIELKNKFKDLIRGPSHEVESYKGCKCNGYKFDCGNPSERTSPNSGVLVIGSSYKKSFGNYYGQLQEVLDLYYYNGHHVILFKCYWFDHTTHIKVDKNRITMVDIKSKLNVEDVFMLSSQAHQVYYAPSITNVNSSWYTILTTKSRQVNEFIPSTEDDTFDDDDFQNDVSNASSSQVDDPSNFFIDLRSFEDDYSIHEDIEQQNDQDMSDDEENKSDDDDDDDDDDD
ncbi:hypothetical protein AgCh_002222 [Apium graveolens]